MSLIAKYTPTKKPHYVNNAASVKSVMLLFFHLLDNRLGYSGKGETSVME